MREAAPPAPPERAPYLQPGSLGIKERRSWATWQLLVAVLLAVVIGMMIGNSGGGGSGQQAGVARRVFTPPPRPDAAAAATPTTASPDAGFTGQAPTSAPQAPTPTTIASATPPSGAGNEVVLMEKTTGSGPRTLPDFTTSGDWKLGWAFRCSGAGQFQVFVVPQGGEGQAVVNKQGAQGQDVTPQSSAGPQHLEVRTSCNWALKVTGVAG